MDSVCLVKDTDFYKNAPISNNYLISLSGWQRNLAHYNMLFGVFSVYTLNEQAWLIIFVRAVYSNE